jgi:CRISPR-associated protein Csa3
MIMAIPKSDPHDNEIGIEDMIVLPAFSLNTLKEEPLRTFRCWKRSRQTSGKPAATNSRKKKKAVTSATKNRSEGVASLDELVLLLDPKIKKGSDAFATERGRLSHHLKIFESLGQVTKTKSGKNVEVRLTRLGEMFV